MTNQTQHKYEYAVDIGSDTASARVVNMVGMHKRVLEVGSGPGSITRLLHAWGHCQVTALEIDEEAIHKVSPYCVKVHKVDLNEGSWPGLLESERFDVVVAADVLEHLYEPLPALAAMGKLINENGYVVVSLPHVGHASVAACLLDEDFEYRDWGLLDRTHIRFFGLRNMESLFKNAGLKILMAEFVIRNPEETEFARRWAGLPSAVRNALLTNPFSLVYQVVIKAVPVARPGPSVALMSMKVEQRNRMHVSGSTRFTAMAMKIIGPNTRRLIRRWLNQVGIRL